MFDLELKKLDNVDKNELSMIEVAHAILADEGKTMQFADLVNAIQKYTGFSDDEIKANAKKRRVKMSDSELKNVREILDIPSVEEGFSEIHIVDKNLYKN